MEYLSRHSGVGRDDGFLSLSVSTIRVCAENSGDGVGMQEDCDHLNIVEFHRNRSTFRKALVD